MHELSLTQSILEIVEQHCQQHQANKVTDIWLEIGPLSCVDPSAIEFCFEVSNQGTIMENCRLHFVPTKAQAYCWQCEKMVEIQQHHSTCPQCGNAHLQAQTGDDLRIKEIAVE